MEEENQNRPIENESTSRHSENRMIEKLSTKILLFMLVLVPYLALIGCTISVYPGLPDEVGAGLPKVLIFLPAFIAIILPATYGVMVFFFSHYLKKAHFLTIAVFMNVGIFGLIGAVYLIQASS